jgi:hypothetical protein
MDRLSDHIKSTYEDETLALFMNFLREDGGPDYEYVGRGERPDRRIRVAGSSALVGVEITRVVEGADAAIRSLTYHLGHMLVSVLGAEEPGGYVELHAGDFPDVSREGIAALRSALETAINCAGGVRNFIKGLKGGFWDYEPSASRVTRFYFNLIDRDGWKTGANAVRPPMRPVLPEGALKASLLGRLRDKAAKAPGYEWEGRLMLLVRNTYQPFHPGADVVAEACAIVGTAFDEVWLVNYREGVRDACPPSPRMVGLV